MAFSKYDYNFLTLDLLEYIDADYESTMEEPKPIKPKDEFFREL